MENSLSYLADWQRRYLSSEEVGNKLSLCFCLVVFRCHGRDLKGQNIKVVLGVD